MLKADMALAVDFAGKIDSGTGSVSCALSGNDACDPSNLAEIAAGFADNDNQWRSEFRDAFKAMTNIGCTGECTPL